MKFDTHGAWMINRVSHEYFDCFIYTAAVDINNCLARFLALTFWFKILFKFFCVFFNLYTKSMIGLSLWDTGSINFDTINRLNSLKNLLYYTLPPHNGHLSTTTTFLCPWGGHCEEVWLYFIHLVATKQWWLIILSKRSFSQEIMNISLEMLRHGYMN